jgi:hypothetical protein
MNVNSCFAISPPPSFSIESLLWITRILCCFYRPGGRLVVLIEQLDDSCQVEISKLLSDRRRAGSKSSIRAPLLTADKN